MSVREALDNWLKKQQPKSAEWLTVCEKMTDDNTLRAMCLKFADDYENGKIPELELLASLSNITGKTFEQMEEIIKGSTNETPQV